QCSGATLHDTLLFGGMLPHSLPTGKGFAMTVAKAFMILTFAGLARAQTDFDLLIKGGHVIDGKNGISAIRDVAIKDGKIAAVEPNIPAERALKTVDVTGLYVTPGLVDMHVHAYHGEIPNGYSKGDRSINPDG